MPTVDAVPAGLRPARQPEHVASADDDPVWSECPGVVISDDQQVELTDRTDELSRDWLASDQITEAPAFVDPGRRHGVQHSHEPVVATVHIRTNTDPHQSSFWRWSAGSVGVGAVVLSECYVWIAALVSNGVVAPEHVDNC